jgi:hypothetical protein
VKLNNVARFHVRGHAGESINLAAAILIQVKTIGTRGNATADGVMRIVDVNQDHGGNYYSGYGRDTNTDNLAGSGPDMP